MAMLCQHPAINEANELECWDDLWRRSDVALPTLRLEELKLFAAQFCQAGSLNRLEVRREGRLLAGLPLHKSRMWHAFNVHRLPVNPWMPCGELLVDPAAGDDVYFDLARRLKALRGSFVVAEWVYDSETWRRLRRALHDVGCCVFSQRQFDVGLINTTGDWESYWSSRSKNHRKSVRANDRRLRKLGEVTFVRQRDFAPGQLRNQLRQAFDIEHRSWKGQQESSVLATPGMFEFYCAGAESMAASGMLELHWLQLDGQNIAFEMGYLAKGIFHSHKVGFDPAYAKFGPGHLLMRWQLEHLFDQPEVQHVDTMSEMTAATRKWVTDSRPRYRHLISTGGSLANLMVRAISTVKPLAKRYLKQIKVGSQKADAH